MSVTQRPFVTLAVLSVLTGSTVLHGAAQQREKSPVFKTYRPPLPPRLEPTSSPEEVAQAFITARKANAGDALAQFELGHRYLAGRGVEIDTAKSAYWFGMASASGVIPAKFNLGILSYNGWGVPWNPFEAFRLFRACAEQGMPEAEYMVGLYYTDNLVIPRDDEKALYWVRKSVEAGYAPAQKTMEALERNASMRANDTAHSPVALQVAVAADTTGIGGSTAELSQLMRETDPEKRRVLGLTDIDQVAAQHDTQEWDAVLRAADAGSPEALTLMGRSFQEGWRTSADRVKAAGFYLRAVHMDAPRALSMLWEVLQQEGFVAELKRRAHDGDVDAQFVWAGLLSVGAGALLLQQQAYLTEDQALRMLKKGAAASHVPSINELGLCYFAGRWVGADPVRARDEWRRARSLGSFEAEIRLAMMDIQSSAENGSERPDTLVIASAVQLLEEGVRRGSVLAEVGLGYCFEHGAGVPKTPSLASEFYRSAAGRGSQDAFRALRRMHDRIRPPDREFAIGEE